MMKLSIYLLLLFYFVPVQAAIDVYEFNTRQQHNLYEQMVEELRCLVCQNQNLSASNAGLAKDLRKQTYDMVMAGKSHDQIVDYMTQRYGDFVLYRPPFKRNTWLLWAGPFILLGCGLVTLLISLRKRLRQERGVMNQLFEEGNA